MKTYRSSVQVRGLHQTRTLDHSNLSDNITNNNAIINAKQDAKYKHKMLNKMNMQIKHVTKISNQSVFIVLTINNVTICNNQQTTGYNV